MPLDQIHAVESSVGSVPLVHLASMSAPIVLILAAGLGTRMKSTKAKVLHQVAGRPLIAWAVATAKDAGSDTIVTILGHQLE